MGIRSDKPIYQLVEQKLRNASEPLTCVALMDMSDVRQEAVAEYGGLDRDVRLATNKLSDTLGFMWRKGLLTRYPAPRESTSLARYAYAWSGKREVELAPLAPPKRLSGKLPVGITEHADCVEIEFERFVILVRPK